MYLLMYLLDFDNFWTFELVLKYIIYKICKLMCSIFFVDNNSCDNKTQWILAFLIQSCYLFKNLMNFLDTWIFRVVLDTIFNKTCRLIYNVYFDNYSHEYKTRRIFDLDKILLLPSCRNVNCFISNHLIFCYSHIYSMKQSICT